MMDYAGGNSDFNQYLWNYHECIGSRREIDHETFKIVLQGGGA